MKPILVFLEGRTDTTYADTFKGPKKKERRREKMEYKGKEGRKGSPQSLAQESLCVTVHMSTRPTQSVRTGRIDWRRRCLGP